MSKTSDKKRKRPSPLAFRAQRERAETAGLARIEEEARQLREKSERLKKLRLARDAGR